MFHRGRDEALTWFWLIFMLGMVGSACYAVGRLHAGLNFRLGWKHGQRAGYREGRRDGQFLVELRQRVS